MELHVDDYKFKTKPTGQEVQGIKSRFTQPASIKNISVENLAVALISGQTVQPGITPFSEASRASGAKGTKDADFNRQIVFMTDIDNETNDIPVETPAHAADLLAHHNLKPAFMYESFSSTAARQRFRIVLVADEFFTDRAERDAVQRALIAAFPQSDRTCVNADRIFFGTDKGLIDGYTDFDAVCKKEDLLAFATAYKDAAQALVKKKSTVKQKFGETIPTGQRHGTLVSFASSVLEKYGVCEEAREAFLQRVSQCEEPKPEDEIEKIWRDACNYYQTKVSAEPGYIPPAEYAAQNSAESLIPSDFTDVGQAAMFAAVYGEQAKYSDATRWIVYNEKVWLENDVAAQGLAQQLTENQLKLARKMLKKAQAKEDAAAVNGDSDKKEAAKNEIDFAKQFRRFVLAERKSSKIAAALMEARPTLQIDVEQLDSDPYLLNTPAGTVDLRTGLIKKHDPADFCTKITAVSPSEEGNDEFKEFLSRVTCHDSALEEYLQEIAGMAAVGKVLRENLIIAFGGGGNGKSTIFNLLSRVLGDYAGGLSSDVLVTNNRNNKKPEFAELRGKRLVVAAELEEGMRLDTAVVKKLCSTDPIRAEKKYKAPFDFIPSHTVVLYTNHLPKVGTIDTGTWDRLIVVPFNAKFRGQEGEVLNYADYLFEHSGGAVLSWIIQGAQKFLANEGRIEEPECVQKSCGDYRAANDWLNNFLQERCELSPDNEVSSSEFYQEYTRYCDRMQDYHRSQSDLKSAMETAGFAYHRKKSGMFVKGLRLKESNEVWKHYNGPVPF